MKNPLTLVGIEPATFRFVAHHLNHCATAVLIHASSIRNNAMYDLALIKPINGHSKQTHRQ